MIPILPQKLDPIPTGLEPEGHLTEPIKGVFFDIYGTLFISESGDIGIAERKSRISGDLQDLLHKYQIRNSPEIVLNRFFDAIRRSHTKNKAEGIEHPEVEIDRIWSAVLGITEQDRVREFAVEYELLVNPAYPMPHLAELLHHCNKKDIKMGVISNAQFFTPLLFTWYLGSDMIDLGFNMDLVILSYQVGCAKPSLGLFEIAAARLDPYGIKPESIVYMGNDLLNDIYPAALVGFQTALFAGDERSLRLRETDPRCKGLKTDLVITDLNQLIDHIG